MTELVKVGLIAASVTLASPFLTGAVLRWTTLKNNQDTAERVEQVRKDLLDANGRVDHKLEEIHDLVNSRLTAALDYIHKLEILLREATGRPMEGEPEADSSKRKG